MVAYHQESRHQTRRMTPADFGFRRLSITSRYAKIADCPIRADEVVE